jgi:hypothetical protein
MHVRWGLRVSPGAHSNAAGVMNRELVGGVAGETGIVGESAATRGGIEAGFGACMCGERV